MKLKYFLLVFAMFCFSAIARSQNAATITGKVTDTKGEPLIGVSILQKGTTNGVHTKPDGIFSIGVAGNNPVLVFSYIGFTTQELAVNSGTTINVSLESDSKSLNEVVVTGYQSQRKKDLTGSVAIVSMKDVKQESTTNVLTGIQGRVPGVEITSEGTPGGGATAIRIRGVSTIGNNNPLYVIDGVPTDNIGPLNPNDVESMQILKDAASASVYGSRANNGVIIITTKRGKSSVPQVTFDAFVGAQQLRNQYEMLDALGWGRVYWEAQRNSGITPTHPQYGNGPEPVLPQFIDAAKTIPAANTNWIDQTFRTAMISSYNVGINQSTPTSNVYAGLGYAKDDGIERYTGYDRFSTRLNASFTIKKRITIGENLQVSHFRQVLRNVMHDALTEHPLIPLYDNLGNFGGPTDGLGDKLNPVGQLYFNRNNQSKNWRIFGNVYLGVDLVPGLKFNSSVGIDYNTGDQKVLEPTYTMGRFKVTQNYVTNNFNKNNNLTWTNKLNYDRSFGDHKLNAFAAVELIKFSAESFSARREGFLLDNPNYDYLDAGTGIQTNGGSGTEWALFSQFGQANYSYKDKYLLSGTIRRDGSSRFSAKNRYGVFPAASAGWRINSEDFMKDVEKINDLKLRMSWGKTGNQQIGDFGSSNFYRTSPEFGGYDLTGSQTGISPGYYINTIGNTNIKWEEQTQWNYGVDLTMFDNQVTFTADYFVKNTTGLLLNPTLLAVYGGGSPPYINAGRVRNSGVELLLNYKSPSDKQFKYSVDLIFSSYKNEVLSLGGQQYILGSEGNRIEPGHPISSFYGYVADGIFKTQAEVDNHAAQTGKGLGRIRYKDLNGDNIVDINDRQYIGNPNPKFNYGLNLNASYKGFDVAVFLSGVYGNDIYNWSRRLTEFAYFPFNFGKSTLGAWSPERPNSTIPSVNVTNPNDELRVSSYFVEKGSYLKVKSLVLGYTIKPAILKALGMERARFYVQGQNLFTFTKYKGSDPEIGVGNSYNLGIDYNAYPHSRSVNLGVNVTF
jgi:TonB-linked SusC/RagA family outer membrane protein